MTIAIADSPKAGPAASAGTLTDRLDLGGGWRADVLGSWDLPASLVERWDDLAEAYGDKGIFLRIGWLQTWWSAFGAGGRLFIVVIRCEDSVRGIFPCWISPEGDVDGMANEGYFDFLMAAPHRSDTLDRFLQVLARRHRSRAHFPYLSQREGNGRLLEDRLRQSRCPHWKWEQPYGATVDVSRPSWEETEGAFHPKLRNSLKKGRRRAEKEGVLTFTEVRAPEAVEATLVEVFAVEASGWKGARGVAIAASETRTAWYRSISLWAARRGALRLYLLRLGTRLIAFDLDVVSGHTVFALRTGFDEGVATRFSAGNLVRFELLRRLWADPDIHRYDFLGPTYAWKREWTPETDVCADLFVYPRSLRGWAGYLTQYGWKQPLKRSARLAAAIRRLRPGRPA